MAVHSPIPAVRAAIVSLLSTTLAGVQVVYGRPADKDLRRECVYAGDVNSTDRIPVMNAGRKHREESFTVDVVVAVSRPRGTVQACDERAGVLAGEIEDVLADDPSLGGVDGLVHAFVSGKRWPSPEFSQEGPVAVVVLEVECLTRLA